MSTIYFRDIADCLRRKIDSMRIKNYLRKNNNIITDCYEEADYIMINTCGVTNDKLQEALTLIDSYKHSSAKIIVLGCIVDTDPEDIDENLIKISIKNLEQLDRYFYVTTHFSDIPIPNSSDDAEQVYYLSICRGCTESCAYCATKKAIGAIKSKAVDSCKESLEEIIKHEPYKIVIDGDNIGAYGLDIGATLSDLLEIIPVLPRKYALNFDMLHPVYFNKNYDAIEKQAAKSSIGFLLIPIQSGSERILKLMHRRGDIGELARKIETLREVSPGLIIGTHIIIGFPTETQEDFLSTLKLLDDINIDWIRIFCFSAKIRTEAYVLSGQLPEKDIRERLDVMVSHLKKSKYFAKYNPAGATLCKKNIILNPQYADNPYKTSCYREVIEL